MRNRNKILGVIAILLIGLAAVKFSNAEIPFIGKTIKGNGEFVTVKREVGPIKKINNAGNLSINIVKRAKPGVEISADSNIVSEVLTEYRKGKLDVHVKDGMGLNSTKPIIVTVFASQLKSVDNSGAGIVTLDGSFPLEKLHNSGSGQIIGKLNTKKKLRVDLNGSGIVDLHGKINLWRLVMSGSGQASIVGIDSKAVFVKSEGQGHVTLSGKTKDLNANIFGAGNIKAEKLAAIDVKVTIAGTGNVYANAAKGLQVNIAGSGNVYYTGKPGHVYKQIAGTGNIVSQ